MAQHDQNLANASGAAFRADLNNALAALFTNSSGASEPSVTTAYMWWADTAASQLKLRNSSNDGWIVIQELDGTMLMEDGTVSAPGLAFASDLNTGFFRSAADKINFATGGVERLEIGSSEVVFNDPSNDVDFRVESNGNSHMLFVDAGNDRVGIGAASPSNLLDVASAVGDGIRIGASPAGTITRESEGLRITGVSTNKNISFVTAGTEACRIDTSGRLLVGTSSSADQNAKIQSATTGYEVFEGFQHGSNAIGAILRLVKSRGSIGSQGLVSNNDELGRISFLGSDGLAYRNSASIKCEVDGTPGTNDMPGRLVFSTTADGASSPTERMRIDSSGRLLVGTTTEGQSSADNLTVADSGHCGVTIRSGTTSEGAIYFSDGTSGDAEYRGQVHYDHDGDKMRFSTAASTRMLIDGSGNVGIGASAPAAKLDVAGNQLFSAANPQIQFNAGGPIIRVPSANTLAFLTDSSNERMRIDSSGVGIGTTSYSDNFISNVGDVNKVAVASLNAHATAICFYARKNNSSNTSDTVRFDNYRSANSAYNFLVCDSNTNSSNDREFTLRGDGNAYADGTWNNNGADYAEFFESTTGAAIPVGTTVVLENNKVRAATADDAASAIMGVVRPKEPGQASMTIGNAAWNKWSGKYLTDDFDRFILDEHLVYEWTEEVEDGDDINHSYESHQIPDGITVPDDVVGQTHDEKGNRFVHYRLNPDYDPDLTYVPREERDEWVIVGLVGQVKILDGQPMNDRWIKMRDVSDTVEEWFIR